MPSAPPCGWLVSFTDAMCSALFSIGCTTFSFRMFELICTITCCGEYTL